MGGRDSGIVMSDSFAWVSAENGNTTPISARLGRGEPPRLAVADDAAGRRMVEMGAEDKSARSRVALAERAARLARLAEIGVEVAPPTRLRDLDGMVHEVARDDGGPVSTLQSHAGVSRRVPGRRLEPDLARDPVVHRNEVGEAGVEDGLHAVRHDACGVGRSEEHTSELQSRGQLVCRLLLE